MSFLTAEWRKLALANYQVDPAVLKRYLPALTELDIWNNTCYLSLVGFMFTNVQVLGMPVPFHRNFEEVNLRFYVRHKSGNEWRRGVVFIRELVPKKAITWVANTVYKEHYETVKMNHQWEITDRELSIEYSWLSKDFTNRFSVRATNLPQPLIPGSEAEFITEHYWGYTRLSESKTTEYEVRHPAWKVYPVEDYSLEVDFGKTYGPDFAFLNELKPVSVMLAEGSAISVENKKKLSL